MTLDSTPCLENSYEVKCIFNNVSVDGEIPEDAGNQVLCSSPFSTETGYIPFFLQILKNGQVIYEATNQFYYSRSNYSFVTVQFCHNLY